MRKYLIKATVLLFFISVLCQSCTNDIDKNFLLRFNEKGEFKIAQFTDIHWDHSVENNAKTIQSIKHVLDVEKPDVAILSGDIVTKAPAIEGWKSIAKVFEEAKMPWAVILGNHDAEIDVASRHAIFDSIAPLPYFIGENGPKDIKGAGNYVLPIVNNDENKIMALLYCMDTNNKPENPKMGHYDWVHFNQIQWYRSMSEKYTIANQGNTLPALAFIHIPLPEYSNLEGQLTTVGTKGEGVASPDVNSGLFSSFLEMGDVMGVFCGHDHDNDYIGLEKDIVLAFGRRSGAAAYGDLEIGARIIQLYEGQRKFDSWICTQNEGKHTYYYYPSGLSSIDEETLPVLKASDVSPQKQGIAYSYYEGKFSTVAEMADAKALKKGELPNFSLDPAQMDDWMGFEYRAWVNIPETSVYRFYTFSDDGSVLYIDNQLVVDNDGSHSERRREAKVHLEKGFHELKLLYFERYMGQMIEVGYASRNILETTLPDSILYVK